MLGVNVKNWKIGVSRIFRRANNSYNKHLNIKNSKALTSAKLFFPNISGSISSGTRCRVDNNILHGAITHILTSRTLLLGNKILSMTGVCSQNTHHRCGVVETSPSYNTRLVVRVSVFQLTVRLSKINNRQPETQYALQGMEKTCYDSLLTISKPTSATML